MESIKIPCGESECSHSCHSMQHGGALTTALTLRGMSPAAIIAYLRWQCNNCGQVMDPLGRTALHMAASCGYCEVAQWLVKHCSASINLRDLESGYTPLHRSIFYGQIHVAIRLIQLGANVSCLDYDDLTAFDIAMKDRMPHVEYNLSNPCEVYAWGSNSNYTLGCGHQKNVPELLDCFRKQNISVKQVAMNKFHSVFVAHDGRVFSCGHGQGGRLGLQSEKAALLPSQMKITPSAPETAVHITAASLGRDHTVLLSEGGVVWTCGLNAHHQLGHTPPPPSILNPRALSPRVVRSMGPVQGICASRFHTVLWGPKGVMTFGLHAGQLGHGKGPEITQTMPKLVAAVSFKKWDITHVAASDGATIVVTQKGDIYSLHEFQCRKLASRQLDVTKVVVVGGHLDSRVDNSTLIDRGGDELKVAIITSTGKLLLWQESSQQLLRCLLTLNRPVIVTDITLCRSNNVLLVTRDGEAFEGQVKVRKYKKPAQMIASSPSGGSGNKFHEFLERSDCEQMRVKRLPHIHRAVSVSCDPKGRNFAIVQNHPQAALLAVPIVESSEMSDQMKGLLQSSSTQDLIHDVVLVVGAREFPAHRFIVESQSEPLAKLIAKNIVNSEEVPKVMVNHVKPEVFEQILLFIYTGDCDLLKSGVCCIKESFGESKENKDFSEVSAFEVYSSKVNNKKVKSKQPQKKQINDPVKVLSDAAKRFEVVSLQKKLLGVKYDNGNIITEKHIYPTKVKFSWKSHQDLYDVTVKSEEGKDLRAHKCILTARLEYCNCMFNHGWLTPSECNNFQLPVAHKALELLIDFLYEDESSSVEQSDDLDLVCNVLVVADQFFVIRLKEICEVTLAGMVTLRNVANILQFSDTYNANQLKQCCMQYICLNLVSVLEMRILECVTNSVLEQLSKYYHEFNPRMSRRVITPYADVPSQSLVESVATAYPVKFQRDDDDDDDDGDMTKYTVKKNVKPMKRRARIRKISTSETNKVNERARNESFSSGHSNISDDEEKSLNFNGLVERQNDDVTLELSKLSCNNEITENNKWVKVTDNRKHIKSVLNRVKCAVLARDNADLTKSTNSWTNLSTSVEIKETSEVSMSHKILQTSPLKIPQTLQQAVPFVPQSPPPDLISDFPELNWTSPSSTPHEAHHKITFKNYDIKNPTKISQKQRKKMAAELMVQNEKEMNENPRVAWNIITNGPSSSLFLDIVQEEMRQSNLSKPTSSPVSLSSDTLAGCSSKHSPVAANPWSKVQTSPIGSPETTVQFCDIVANEKKQREKWTKMIAKPLELTQLEDQAIEDLLLFYNAAGASDERITVQRVTNDPVVPPTWITSHH